MESTMNNKSLEEIFHDVKPISQDEGPTLVCSINYTEEFIESMDYLRAVMKLDERSERALFLTSKCLKLNPANYTTWHFRRECIKSLSNRNSLRKELDFASEIGGANPKNYQIWYHRRALLESYFKGGLCLKEARNELSYVAEVFSIDAKNYHAWAHRQWILKTLNEECLWGEELNYVHSLVVSDHRNNSAWNQRWFVVHNRKDAQISQEEANIEADYALKSAAEDPYNESCWRYFVGIVTEQHRVRTPETKNDINLFIRNYLGSIERLRQAWSLTEGEEGAGFCFQLTSAQIDLLELIQDKESLSKAVTLTSELAEKYDRIRVKYWNFKKQEIIDKLNLL